MAKVSDLLKNAILTSDWQPVCDVYFAMTGERIEPPAKIYIPTIEEIGDMDLDALSSHREVFTSEDEEEEITEDDDDEEEPPQKSSSSTNRFTTDDINSCIAPSKKKDSQVRQRVDDDGIVRTEAKKVPLGQPLSEAFDRTVDLRNMGVSTKKWSDSGKLHADQSVKVNPKFGAGEISPRGERTASKKITVRCSICDKKFSVLRSLAYGYSKNEDENRYRCNTCCNGKRRKKDK